MIKAPFNSSLDFTTCTVVEESHDLNVLFKIIVVREDILVVTHVE